MFVVCVPYILLIENTILVTNKRSPEPIKELDLRPIYYIIKYPLFKKGALRSWVSIWKSLVLSGVITQIRTSFFKIN